MPRGGGELGAGYDMVPVCAFCIEYLNSESLPSRPSLPPSLPLSLFPGLDVPHDVERR